MGRERATGEYSDCGAYPGFGLMGSANATAAQWFLLELRDFIRCGKAWHRHPSTSPNQARERNNQERDQRLANAQEQWLRARPGREIIITRGNSNQRNDSWEVVFVEDDKALFAVRGSCRADTLRKALAELGLLRPNDDTVTND